MASLCSLRVKVELTTKEAKRPGQRGKDDGSPSCKYDCAEASLAIVNET